VPELVEPLSHYTDAVRWGDLLFISGQVALGSEGEVLHPGDVAGQARVVHENVAAILRQAGSDYAHVLKVTVYLTDVADRQAVNAIRKEFFGEARPASTLVEVSALAVPGLLVEMEAVAAIP
jgi:reactive intermediate/imine deaminase